MSFEFEYKGGVAKPSFHETCKFLLFFVVGSYEVPFYQMLENNLIFKLRENGKMYASPHNVVKVFVAQQGDEVAKQFHSFYINLIDGPAPRVKILPFPDMQDRVDYYFAAKGKFLSKNALLDILADDAASRPFVKHQRMLPLKTLRQMVKIDRNTMKEGVRHVIMPRLKTFNKVSR